MLCDEARFAQRLLAHTTTESLIPVNFLQYTVMAFGMCNASATSQRLMWKVLSGIANCKAYLDDVVVYSNDWESHLETL